MMTTYAYCDREHGADMRVITVACLEDNYAYVLVDRARRAVVIDPSEAAPVLSVLERESLELDAIWLTHHHWDHVGGVNELCKRYANVPVVGSAYDAAQARIVGQTRSVRAGDELAFADHVATVLEVPGHTLGAVAYRVGHCLFTGDTLFLGGCGRVFEGTLPQMQSSLAQLRALDPTLLVYPGHEYTVSNLTFGMTVEPNNQALAARLGVAQATRAQRQPTVPGRLSDELATNVLLRWDAPDVIAYAESRANMQDSVDSETTHAARVFGAIRRAKDHF